MPETDPLEISEVPFREVELSGYLELPKVTARLEQLYPVSPEPIIQGNPSLVDRIRAVWTIVSAVAEDAVVVAEVMMSGASGKQKKAAVVDTVMDWIKQLEERVDVLPNWMQGLIFRALSLAVGMMVERAFGNALRSGEVNRG